MLAGDKPRPTRMWREIHFESFAVTFFSTLNKQTMILEIENWHCGYEQIKADCCNDNSNLLILVHPDGDALAAARIVAYMLRSDNVSFTLQPVGGVQQLESVIQKNATNAHYSAILLINLGASRNATRWFGTSEGDDSLLNPSRTKVYLMDCRRPVHLANIYAGENVVVFVEEHDNDVVPSDGDGLSGGEDSESEEDDDDSESENEEMSDDEDEKEFDDDGDIEGLSGGNDENDAPVREPLQDSTNQIDDGYDGGEEDQESDPKRQKTLSADSNSDPNPVEEENAPSQEETPTPAPSLSARELYLDRRRRVQSYYANGSYFGAPASFMAYRVATQLRFGQVPDLLWLACVGVTDAYLHARVDLAGYSTLSMELKTACLTLFPNDATARVQDSVYAEQLSGEGTTRTKIGLSGNGRILAETDYRFFLLRHTSLFNAMVYSDYMATRLQLNTTRGMHRLKELLAKMGFPLEECHQPFSFMKPTLRRRLRDKMEEFGEEYGLDNFQFTSFFRITGYQSLLSASDTSYAIAAILESAGSNSSDEAAEDQAQKEAFNMAFDALNANSVPSVSLDGLAEGSSLASLVNGGKLSGNGLGAGLRLAMALQKIIMSTASNLVERNAITRLLHFRYAYLTVTNQHGDDEPTAAAREPTGDEGDHIFAKPLALCRLANYLMDLHRENGKWVGTKSRPLILLAEKPRTRSYMVVGYEYPETAGDLVKNRFGQSFELAAQSIEGTFRFDSFDSNVVEVGAKDVQRFMEQLHYLMDSL